MDKWDLLVKGRLTEVGTVYKLKQKGSLTAHNGLMGMEVPPNFAHCHPRSCGGRAKDQRTVSC